MKKIVGFTLVELLVSLVLFAILGVLVANALQNSIQTYQVTRHASENISQLTLTRQLMQHDFSAIQPRPTIDASNTYVAPIYFPSESTLEIITASRSNPGGMLNQSTLQAVRYSLQDSELIRTTWPTLDGRLESQATHEVLLDKIESLQFSLTDKDGSRNNTWTLSNTFNDPHLPTAVSVDIIFKNQSEFHTSIALDFQLSEGGN